LAAGTNDETNTQRGVSAQDGRARILSDILLAIGPGPMHVAYINFYLIVAKWAIQHRRR